MLCGVANFHSEVKGTPPAVLAASAQLLWIGCAILLPATTQITVLSLSLYRKINVRPRQLRNTGRASFNCQTRDTYVF